MVVFPSLYFEQVSMRSDDLQLSMIIYHRIALYGFDSGPLVVVDFRFVPRKLFFLPGASVFFLRCFG